MAIPRVARYTWARHWPAVALTGLSFGVVHLAPFAATRTLGADDDFVARFIALCQVVWILAPAVGPFLQRADPQRAWRWLAVLAYAPILLIGMGGLPVFLAAFVLHSAVQTALVPHRGALIRTNYPSAVRGRMYGLLQCVTFLAAMAAARIAAPLMDRHPDLVRVVFPAAALVGGAGLFLHGRIRWRHQRRRRALPRVPGLREMLRVLRRDRAFRVYQIGFMLYGFGFLMAWPLHIIYANRELGLDNSQWAWAQVFAFPAAQILLIPVWGRVADWLGVVRTAALAFLVLASFLAVMPFVEDVYGLVAAFFLYGAAMAGVDVGWSLGPLHFARDGEAHMYAAIHFSMVGIRSAIAPFLGLALRNHFSYAVGYGTAAALLLCGTATIWRLPRLSSFR